MAGALEGNKTLILLIFIKSNSYSVNIIKVLEIIIINIWTNSNMLAVTVENVTSFLQRSETPSKKKKRKNDKKFFWYDTKQLDTSLTMLPRNNSL